MDPNRCWGWRSGSTGTKNINLVLGEVDGWRGKLVFIGRNSNPSAGLVKLMKPLAKVQDKFKKILAQ